MFGWKVKTIEHTTAIFRQINKSQPHTHHDALEFPDGHIELLTDLSEGQTGNSASASGSASYPGRGAGSGKGRVRGLTAAFRSYIMTSASPSPW